LHTRKRLIQYPGIIRSAFPQIDYEIDANPLQGRKAIPLYHIARVPVHAQWKTVPDITYLGSRHFKVVEAQGQWAQSDLIVNLKSQQWSSRMYLGTVSAVYGLFNRADLGKLAAKPPTVGI